MQVIDVDGSYLQRKHKQMADAGMNVAPLDAPTATPLSGWEVMTEANVKDIAKKLPRVTSGNVVHTYILYYIYSCWVVLLNHL